MACQCPPTWGAIIPPPCDDHNPPGPKSLRERLGIELERHLAGRRTDPEFRERLARRMEEDAKILRRLS